MGEIVSELFFWGLYFDLHSVAGSVDLRFDNVSFRNS